MDSEGQGLFFHPPSRYVLRITVSVDTVSLDDESNVIAYLKDDEMARVTMHCIGSAALFCIALLKSLFCSIF